MITSLQDTIVAIATPRGQGAIAVIRISGQSSLPIAQKIFTPYYTGSRIRKGKVILGYITTTQDDAVSTIDQVILTFFSNPHSYTGEDIIEISCHGGTFIVQEIFHLILQHGARLAEPGEFTLRAFLNGKIDLVQAESVNDLINARTLSSLQLSFSQLNGGLSTDLTTLKNSLRQELALLEHELDFSEEDDIQFASRQKLFKDITTLITHINNLLQSFQFGKIIREGARIVITGKPNVGKSSILNRLLQEDRAIVSAIPGTTRDSLEESLNIDGVLFVIIDTAGLRKTTDLIEAEGVRRTENLLKTADIILHIIDSSNPDALNEPLQFTVTARQKMILVFNKIDIYQSDIVALLENIYKAYPKVKVSARTGDGFELLKKEMLDYVYKDQNFPLSQTISNVRHLNALERSRDFLHNVLKSLGEQLPPEFLAMDIRGALNCIGEITGEVTSDDIINDIFSHFCIGK